VYHFTCLVLQIENEYVHNELIVLNSKKELGLLMLTQNVS